MITLKELLIVLHLNEQFRHLDEISDDSEQLPPTVNLTLLQLLLETSTISGLLKLWMSSRVPLMDMYPPHPSHTKSIMIYSLMVVLGMIKQKRLIQAREEMPIISLYILPMLTIPKMPLTLFPSQVDYTVVSFYKSCILDHVKALELITVNSSASAFPGGSRKNLHIWSSKSTIGPSIY